MSIDGAAREIGRRTVLAAGIAAVADVVVFAAARALGVSFALGLAGIERVGGMTWYLVATVAGVAALGGGAYAAVLRRAFAPQRAARVFAWTVAGVAVLSCLPLLALGRSPGTTVALALLHLVAGGVALAVLAPALRRR